MGYFSNGTEGMFYQENYCFQCKNYRDKKDGRGFGCAIWDAHLMFNGEEVKKEVLNILIERDKETGQNCECSMFIPAKENRRQTNDGRI